MKTTSAHDERIANMIFGSVYPLYLNKIEKKGRSQAELDQVVSWLTGHDKSEIQNLIDKKVTFETFFAKASIHPDAALITGMVCGHRVEEIENPLTRQVRQLDKLVDELAKGRRMERILRN